MTIGVAELRLQIGERVPSGGTAEDTLFTDDEIEMFISRGGGRYFFTLAYAWSAKAGILSELVDVVEDGSQRLLSQRFRNADRRAEHFGKKAVEEELADLSDIPRAVGKGFDVWCTPDPYARASRYLDAST